MTRRLHIPTLLVWLAGPAFWLLVIAGCMPASEPMKFPSQAAQRPITAVCFRIEGDAELKCIEVREVPAASKTAAKEPAL